MAGRPALAMDRLRRALAGFDAYDDVPTGRVGLVVDSSGLLSIAVARSSAAADFGLAEGAEIRITTLDGDPNPRVVTSVELGRRPS